MSAPYFSTPPLQEEDFKKNTSLENWSKFIGDSMNDTITTVETTVGPGKSQFYNPETTPAEDDKDYAKVTWNGFPRRLVQEYPDNYYEIADKKDGWPLNDGKYTFARNQDEYVEWYVYKDAQDKITRIDFTCEGPEYWEKLFELEPDVCLELYKKHISAEVKMEDLYTLKNGDQTYNPYNKWNTTDGAMHLNCPPNTLGAEIQLAGDASVIRQKNGVIVTDSQELINCSRYGVASRNSDPHIGSQCNTLCRAGKRITLDNPVCLFIADIKTSGWRTPDGEDASKYMELIRGTEEKGLRYTLKVPASKGFTVGDITIAGEPIIYGGQVVSQIDVGLVAECCTNKDGAQPPHPCKPRPSEVRYKGQHCLQRC